MYAINSIKYVLYRHSVEITLAPDISYSAEEIYDILRDQFGLDPVEEGEYLTEEEGRAALAASQPRTVRYSGNPRPYLLATVYVLEKLEGDLIDDEFVISSIQTVDFSAEPYEVK